MTDEEMCIRDSIGTYIGECSDKEMENIDIALMISLQLDGNMKTSKKQNETIKEQQEEIDHLKTEIEEMEKDCKELIDNRWTSETAATAKYPIVLNANSYNNYQTSTMYMRNGCLLYTSE